MKLAELYKKMARWPFGKKIFSIIASQKAPYFATISPYVENLTETGCIVWVKKRRRVLNHLKTVNAIAMCNACEFAFGLTMEAGIPPGLRWIPKGMTVRYLKKLDTNFTATCEIPDIKSFTSGDHIAKVIVENERGELVMDAEITVYVSERKS